MEGKKVIASLGWFGHQNCGDEMFKEALPHLFPSHEFLFFSVLKKNIDYINQCDILFIGGGNIVDPVFLEGLEKITIPYYFLGVGITEQKNAGLVLGAQQVFVRDQRSLDFIDKSYAQKYLAPDLAFSMKANKENGRKLLQNIPTVRKGLPTIGLFLNDCVNSVAHSPIIKFIEYNKVILELARFLDNLPYNIVFIPMSFLPPDDRRMSLDVAGNMRKGYNTHCVVNQMTPQDCLDLTSALDFAITMRLHASIFCTIGNVPFFDITHHSKAKSYLDTEGLSQLSVDYYSLTIKSIEEKFSEIKNNPLIKEKLESTYNKNHIKLRETIQNVYLP